MRMWVFALAATALTAMTSTLGAGAGSAEPVIQGPLPVPFDVGAGLLPFVLPEMVPAGANDPNCRPSQEHPNPVILVNGTFVNQAANFQAGAPFLKNNGYCVYTFNYGKPVWISEIPIQSIGDIRDSARELAAQVDRVRAQTGAEKVDLVGVSQGGGLMPLYYINKLGGDRYVDKMVGISPSNHGTSGSGAMFLRKAFPPLGQLAYGALEALAPAAGQQAVGSPVQAETYGEGDTRPGVTYTTIVTKYDEVVTPYTNQFLDGPNVENILLQDGCDLDFSDHLSTSYSERVWRFVLNALDPAHQTPVPCIPVGFVFPGLN